MRAREFSCDAQAETVSRRLLVTASAIESLENVWCAFRWNSRAAVADTDLDNVIVFLGRKQNLAAGSIVFYGILHQVLHRERNHLLVTLHRESFGNVAFHLKVIRSAENPGIFTDPTKTFADVKELMAGVRGRANVLEGGDLDGGIWSTGQSQALIHDIPTCAELVRNIMSEADQIIDERFAKIRG